MTMTRFLAALAVLACLATFDAFAQRPPQFVQPNGSNMNGDPGLMMNPLGNTSLLGRPTRIILSCKEMIQSMTWWSRLGFIPVAELPVKSDSAISLTDGQIIITLVAEVLPSPIIMFSCPSIKTLKDSLEKLDINTTFDVKGPGYGEIRLLSPNGVYLMVRPSTDELPKPVKGDSNLICGRLTEFSIGTGFLKKEQTYWETLGFSVKRGGNSPYNYALMTDGMITIGLHENREIVSLAFTYFAADMPDRISRLEKSGIVVEEETPSSSNRKEHGRVVSPDGQTVFLFTGNQ